MYSYLTGELQRDAFWAESRGYDNLSGHQVAIQVPKRGACETCGVYLHGFSWYTLLVFFKKVLQWLKMIPI